MTAVADSSERTAGWRRTGFLRRLYLLRISHFDRSRFQNGRSADIAAFGFSTNWQSRDEFWRFPADIPMRDLEVYGNALVHTGSIHWLRH